MTTAETEEELIEEFRVQEDRDPQRHVAPRQTGNSIREIEVLSSPDPSPISTIDHATEVRIADEDHQDHPYEIRERRYESAIEVGSCLTREALRNQSVAYITLHQANVGRVEAHLHRVHIIRSQDEHHLEVHHAQRVVH